MNRDFSCRKIRKNKGSSRPAHVLYFDSETKVQKHDDHERHRMDMAWVCHWRKRSDRDKQTESWHYFAQTESLNKFIDGKCLPSTILYIFGHNIFFDLQACDFFYYFTQWGWVLDFFYDKGMTYILCIRKGNRSIKCLSTTNYFPVSLKKLGDWVGLPKLDVDFETTDRETMSDYCKRDVEIIKLTMERYWSFLDQHDLGNFAMTRSGQAFTAFRHRFMLNEIAPHQNEDISDFERKAYFGGRVECGQVGKIKGGPFVSLDVNSMYPFVMKTFRYPTRLVDVIEYPTDEQVRKILDKACCCAHVWLNTDEPAYAVRKDNKIIFPVGTFDTYVCTEGLRYAMNHGHLHDVTNISAYEKDWIFQHFVDYFYKLKQQYGQEQNAIMREFCKLFLNGLYGKFAQKRPLIEDAEDITFDGYFREEVFDLLTGQTEVITKLFNKRFRSFGEETAKNSFVAISAHVTEYARFYLWRLIKETGQDRVLYCDTDSIKIRQRDMKQVKAEIHPVKLGALKKEEVFKELSIFGPKHYITDTHRRIKGVPNRANKIDDLTFEYLHFPRQDTHLRKQVTRYVIAQTMRKVLKGTYDKGNVSKTGKITPFRLSIPLPSASLRQRLFSSGSSLPRQSVEPS